MKWNELRRLAEEKGWRLYRHGAKHDIYSHPDKDYFIQLERHEATEVKKGILQKLLKQIGG
ncbi:MAG: type II toxin-antitoxin system HicA family toxin [Bacteroidales bacterium]|nr:type II toxin-antitoxin system HicA family toxin [Bacteroidales bacterium]